MPGSNHGPSIKNPKVYEALRRKGMSKSQAAAISNAQVEDALKDRNLPLEVKQMPAEAKSVWRAAFRNAIKEEPDQLAGLLAFRAVQKEFKRIENEEGEEEWISREEAEKEELAAMSEEAEAMALAAEQLEGGEGEGEGEEGEEGDPEPDEGDEPSEYSRTTKTTETTETSRGGKKRKAAEGEEQGEEDGEGEGTGDSIEMIDTLTLDAGAFRLTNGGYLVANPRVARIGIQVYKGYEVGRPDMDEVRVYRPEAEVFDHAAMKSLAHKPITLDHPPTSVDSSNWKEHAVGKSEGHVARDGDFIRVPLMLMDADAIEAAQRGKSQLSVGYGAKLVWGDGVTPAGEPYDAMQTKIVANHIALVSSARGGKKLNIGDSKKRARAQGLTKLIPNTWGDEGDHRHQTRRVTMTDLVNLDGVTIELEDKDGQILTRHLAGLNQKLRDQGADVDALKKQIAELQTQIAAAKQGDSVKDGEIVALKAKVADSVLTPQKLDDALNLRMDVVDRAMTFFGDAVKYAWQGKTDQQIRRDVVTHRLGDAKVKLMNDDTVTGAFLSLTETETQDGFTRMTQSFSGKPAGGSYNDAAAKAYDKRNEQLANAFKKNRKAFGATA